LKQSPNDLKHYLPLTLDNGLRVLLIQNQETQKSAAALAVNVGHFSDPSSRQGLAHFLEHMLFLGTEKYPDGSEYQQFISQYGGSNNAWTATEHTCFYFDIHHDYFVEAIDRFSQFFIAPLLSAEFVNNERKNIDAEFKLKLKDDIRRLYDVHKETINPEHPFSKFSVGNTETLCDRENENLRDEVAQFFASHYVAKTMTLVLEGPQSLDELENIAKNYFTSISSNEPVNQNIDVPLYLPEHQQVCLYVKPVKNDHQLIVSFALPSIDDLYREKPESILSYLLGHEGPHSLLSVLKIKGWALGLTAGSGINGYNFKDFNISIRLTEQGEDHIDDIISVVFSFVALLKQDNLPQFYYQEKKSIAELSFHYQEKLKPLDSVCQLVINMQHYPTEDYIFGDYVMAGMNNEKISELLNYLTPENMRYVFVSQHVPTNQISRWYQVPYKVEKISQKQIKKWQKTKASTDLSLPPQNNYIVNNPIIYTDDQAESSLNSLPTIIADEAGLKVWFKQDTTFNTPKGYIYIGIDSALTLENVKNIAMTRLFVDLYTDSVIEQHYDAELAGIHYNLYSHQGGLTLQLSGVSEKQSLLLEKLLEQLQNPTFAENKFHLLKQQIISHWTNSENSKSISQLFSILSSVMQPKNPSSEALTNALNKVDYIEFSKFCSHIFKKITVDVLIHGNWQLAAAKKIQTVITNAFSGQYHSNNRVKIPVLDITNKGNIEIPLYLPEHDYASVIYYPIADKSLESIAKSMIISQILSPLFFQQMRTEKQYGYLVGVGFVPINKYPGLAFYIQSPNYDAQDLAIAMNEFINDCHLAVEQMPEEHWQNMKHGLASQLQEKDTSLRIKSQRFWASICNKDTDFQQKQHLINALLSLTKQDIYLFLINQINNDKQKIDRFCLMTVKQPKDGQLPDTIINNQKLVIENLNKCSIKF